MSAELTCCLCTFQWDTKGISTWHTSRARSIFGHNFGKSFWSFGNFGTSADNGESYPNPWTNATVPNAAPFDQEFFLILNVAVGESQRSSGSP